MNIESLMSILASVISIISVLFAVNSSIKVKNIQEQINESNDFANNSIRGESNSINTIGKGNDIDVKK